MISSRRAFLQMSVAGAALSSATVRAQGVVDRQVHAQPRGPKSNLPFHSRFTDIAHEAGLRLPTIYGPVDHKDYIMEAVGFFFFAEPVAALYPPRPPIVCTTIIATAPLPTSRTHPG
jgi:hypothetical protein